MTIATREIEFNPEYKKMDDPWKEFHDMKTTQESIKQLLAGGTPDWVKHPEDWKNYAKEAFAAEKEISDKQVMGYRIDDQEELVDFRARNVNIISTRDFIKKLRDNGVRCFTIYNGLPGTIGLWAVVPTTHGMDVRYIAFLQIPAMIEWSVLRVDRHGLPNGEDYRGWRTVVSQLIRKEVLTEERAHEIFGRPTDSIVSRRYRRTLYGYRNRKYNAPIRDGF
jgi:hypothetical protein